LNEEESLKRQKKKRLGLIYKGENNEILKILKIAGNVNFMLNLHK
jgi:hypothetical protein